MLDPNPEQGCSAPLAALPLSAGIGARHMPSGARHHRRAGGGSHGHHEQLQAGGQQRARRVACSFVLASVPGAAEVFAAGTARHDWGALLTDTVRGSFGRMLQAHTAALSPLCTMLAAKRHLAARAFAPRWTSTCTPTPEGWSSFLPNAVLCLSKCAIASAGAARLGGHGGAHVRTGLHPPDRHCEDAPAGAAARV